MDFRYMYMYINRWCVRQTTCIHCMYMYMYSLLRRAYKHIQHSWLAWTPVSSCTCTLCIYIPPKITCYVSFIIKNHTHSSSTVVCSIDGSYIITSGTGVVTYGLPVTHEKCPCESHAQCHSEQEAIVQFERLGYEPVKIQ